MTLSAPVPAEPATTARDDRPRRLPEARAVEHARTIMVLHRLDPDRGRCAACGADSPCPASRRAAEVLVAAGAWNTVPFTSPAARARPAATVVEVEIVDLDAEDLADAPPDVIDNATRDEGVVVHEGGSTARERPGRTGPERAGPGRTGPGRADDRPQWTDPLARLLRRLQQP